MTNLTRQRGRQLTSLQKGTTAVSYVYNSDGLRAKKTVGSTVTSFSYNDMGLLAKQTTGANKLIFFYDNAGNIKAMEYNGTRYFLRRNAQGDVIALLLESGAVVANYSYDAWGKLLSVTDSSGNAITSTAHIANINPIRYRGYYYDTETGFYSLQSRYYDPEIGRFINSDGYVSTGQGILGNNMFAYCLNNPVNNHDPSGKFALTATFCGIALWKIGVALVAAATLVIAADTIAKNPPAIPSISLPKINVKPKTDSKEKDLAPSIPKDPPKSTPIYRYYSSKTENLAPRPGKDYDGLSFSTTPPRPGVSAVVTTIEEVNATGILVAMPTGGSHVTVMPTNGTVLQWMEQGQSSTWSQTLSNIVIEWDGVN